MKVIRLAMLGLCVLVLAFAGRALTVHSAKPVADGKAAPSGRDAQGVSDREWVEILRWMRKYRHNQAAVFDNMPDGSQKEQVKQLVANQYREIQRIPFDQLQKARLNEITAQDELFGAQLRFHAARRNSGRGAKLDEARGAVHTAVEHVFDAQIAEKQVRIDRLQAEIKLLENNKSTTVDRWARQAMNEGRGTMNASPRPLHSPGETSKDEAERAAKP